MVWLVLLILLVAVDGHAACTSNGQTPATWTSSVDQPSLQLCVNNAVNGDTINVLAGTADYSGLQVNVLNKNIAIIGAGIDQSIITCNTGGMPFQFKMDTVGQKPWRLSGFTIQFNVINNQMIWINSTSAPGPTYGWRIDHVKFTNTSGAIIGKHAILNWGISWGLIDHVTFNGAGFAAVHTQGLITAEDGTCSPTITKCYGGVYWNRDTNLGSDEAIYLEDCTINFSPASDISPVNDAQYGGSLVIRHCSITGAYIQNHSTGHENGKMGGFKLEVYNNTFNGTHSSGFTRWVFMRSGSGVFFNNTVSGYNTNAIDLTPAQRDTGMPAGCSETTSVVLGLCNGLNAFDGNIESSGWPCLGDCGRGGALGATNATQQVNLPIYSWNNGTEATCASGGACANAVGFSVGTCTGATVYLKTIGSTHTNGQVDYVNNGTTAKPGYTPYTYPHPLQGSADTTPPSAPTGVMISQVNDHE